MNSRRCIPLRGDLSGAVLRIPKLAFVVVVQS
jgi:hypothetical protein